MATPAKKKKVVDSATPAAAKGVCPYGASCYRKNPAHFTEFSHPKDGATTSKVADGTVSKATVDSSAASASPLPACKYGAKCYRKNLMHYAEFSHPTSGPTSDPADDSGGDTDVYDSDDDKDGSKGKGNDILSRGMSLVKSFSQMTEAERKDLIKRAFQAKQQLQEELAATKKQVQLKDKELNKLQEEVNKGILLVDGEDEAMKGDDTVFFSLVPERNYREGSADQIHFRLAESQFYRLISGDNSGYRVNKVEYVVTPDLVKRFKAAKEKLHKGRGEAMSNAVLGFHGTDEKNIVPICETGFRVPGESGFSHKTDTGWYGAGVYFSEYPAYSMGYITDSTKLLLCQVLPGKVYECPGLIHGAKLKAGFDSHMSPCRKELIIFNSHHILPCYIVHYDSDSNTDFTYKKYTPETRRTHAKTPAITDAEIKKKKAKALKVAKANVFNGMVIKYVGPKSEETEIIKQVIKHQGTKGTNAKYTVVVAHSNSSASKILQAAMKNDLPVVTEEFVWESILQTTPLAMEPYLHEVYES